MLIKESEWGSMCGHPLYWHNCYKDGYNLITPESYAHPAKMAPALCFRILEHLKELGLLHAGDTILDPMAGTGLTNICAGAKGYKSISVELEEKFVSFQRQNLEYAHRKLFKELDWQIIQGDSRKLSELLSEKGMVTVSSPPFLGSQAFQDKRFPRIMIQKGIKPQNYTEDALKVKEADYGHTPGQIGNMKDTPLKAITSPPYGIDMKTEGGIDWAKANRPDRRIEINPVTGKAYTRHNVYGVNTGGYGDAGDNIGNLPDKPLKAVMSPPYGDAMGDWKNRDAVGAVYKGEGAKGQYWYGNGAANIGNLPESLDPGEQSIADWWRRKALGESNETYLQAMLQVYREVAKVSDVLTIVIKNPTRNKQLRRLDLDTIEILRQAGWYIHCQHRALLFEELEQGDLFNGSQKRVKGRMSFFKRLSWQNGQPVASWEDIIIATRNLSTQEARE